MSIFIRFVKDLWNESWLRHLLLVDIVNIVLDIGFPSYDLGLPTHLFLFGAAIVISIFQIYRKQANRIDELEKLNKIRLPNLVVLLFDQGTNQYEYSDLLALTTRQHSNNYLIHFGIVLLNKVADTVAEGIDIRLELSWSGSELKYAPNVIVPKPSNWITEYEHISGTHGHATLRFTGGANNRVPQRQPLSWRGFGVQFSEKVEGSLLIDYIATSAHPKMVQNSGRLVINVSSSA
jgi:hypothetical protein